MHHTHTDQPSLPLSVLRSVPCVPIQMPPRPQAAAAAAAGVFGSASGQKRKAESAAAGGIVEKKARAHEDDGEDGDAPSLETLSDLLCDEQGDSKEEEHRRKVTFPNAALQTWISLCGCVLTTTDGSFIPGDVHQLIIDYADMTPLSVLGQTPWNDACFAVPLTAWSGSVRGDNAMKDQAFAVAIRRWPRQFPTLRYLSNLGASPLTRPGHGVPTTASERQRMKSLVDNAAITVAVAQPSLFAVITYQNDAVLHLRFDDRHFDPWHLQVEVPWRGALAAVSTGRVLAHHVFGACDVRDARFSVHCKLVSVARAFYVLHLLCKGRCIRNNAAAFRLRVSVPLVLDLS